MYADYQFFVLQDREIREQERSERMDERRTQALATSRGPSLRAQMARRLFALAVAAERDLELGLGKARSEGRFIRRPSPQGAAGQVGVHFVLPKRYAERSDSKRGYTERRTKS